MRVDEGAEVSVRLELETGVRGRGRGGEEKEEEEGGEMPGEEAMTSGQSRRSGGGRVR